MAEVLDRELQWDDEIENDGSEYVVLPEGDYDFCVESFERGRYKGGAKIPACNQATLKLDVIGNGVRATIPSVLILHTKLEWKLCQFFVSIGQRKHGEKQKMNWQAVPGAKGRCKIGVRTWTGDDGKEHESNEVLEFYEPATTAFTPGAF